MSHRISLVMRRSLKTVGLTLAFLCISIPASHAENQIGGHFGVLFAPLISSQDDSTIFDNFTIGFPMGITVKRGDKWAFDLELVTGVDTDPLSVGLVDPEVADELLPGVEGRHRPDRIPPNLSSDPAEGGAI